MGYEPITNCRECDEILDVYEDFDHRFCECCADLLLSEGTTHFQITRYPGNAYAFIEAKPDTRQDAMYGSHASLYPGAFGARAKDERNLLGELLKTEAWYIGNRKLVEAA